MNRNRENLLKRLVDRKMASISRGESFCNPCETRRVVASQSKKVSH